MMADTYGAIQSEATLEFLFARSRTIRREDSERYARPQVFVTDSERRSRRYL